MKILLDEGIPRRLAALLRDSGLEASALPPDWRGVTDELLQDRAEKDGFTILITQDQNMPFQRRLDGRSQAVLLVPQLDRRRVLSEFDASRDRLPTLEAGRYALLGRSGSLPSHPTKPLWD